MKDSLLTQTDLLIFFGTLIAIMAAGLIAGWKEKTSADYFLAGKNARWWGVAGSIFGSNVSANHMVGMMGVGFAVGFAQSHFEITAIAGLLMLCYILLPVYRKLNIYTLSEYLNRRYDDRARLAYAVIMLTIIVFVMTVPAFYIGSRSINFLIKEDTGQKALAQVVPGKDGNPPEIRILNGGAGYNTAPTVNMGDNHKFQAVLGQGTIAAIVMKDVGFGYNLKHPPLLTLTSSQGDEASLVPIITDGKLTAVHILDGGQGYSLENPPKLEISAPRGAGKPATAFVSVVNGGLRKIDVQPDTFSNPVSDVTKLSIKGGGKTPELSPGDIDRKSYIIGILAMAIITGTYTVIGGLRAVIVTDVIQSVLMLVAGILVAFFMFQEVGGWAALREMDLAINGGKERFHLYNPANHPALPWTGVLTGLMVLHFYYWGANQFIVQRALAAKTDKEARVGIVSAGFFKLLIPFFSIGCGIAAWYYYADRAQVVAQDTVFLQLLADLISPLGWGLVGLVAAGVFGAILSSIDSMLNSGATIITFDFYKRFVNPDASDQQLIRLGKIWVGLLLVLAAGLTILTMDPNSDDSFFLHIAKHQSNLIAGVVVVFFLGMLWNRATATGAFVAIIGGVVFSYLVPYIYSNLDVPVLKETFGVKLNFMHAVFVSTILSLILHIVVSLNTQPDKAKSKLTWVGLGIFSKQEFQYFTIKLIGSMVFYAFLAILMLGGMISSKWAAILAAGWTWLMFLDNVFKMMLKAAGKGRAYSLLKEDRFWGGLLASCAVYMMFYFR
jgi:SSS family solute:Na+ symporter